MPEIPITLIRGEKVGAETDWRDALPVNMYAVKKDILGAQGYMIDYPGLMQHATGAGIDRGGIYNDRFETQFRVSGTSMIELDSGGSVTTLGTISGSGQVALPFSFNTQAVIADGKYFLYDSTNGFREVTDPDLGDPIDAVWINGYYFFTDGEYIYHTDLNDETAIDPLKFATAEFMPDKSLGVSKTNDNKVIVWGRYSAEYFVDIAADNFAFTRVETRAQKIGIVATHAKCEASRGFYITGGRKEDSVFVYRFELGNSYKVSTREVDKIIKQYTEPELSDMRMETRVEDDITFIIIHLPNETLVFNESIAKSFGVESAWAILKTDIQHEKTYRGINGVFDSRNAKWIYGDKRDSTVGYLDESICTHYGEAVEGILYTPLMSLDGISIDEIEIQTIPGFNASADATVAFSTTEDGQWYSQEYWNLYSDPKDFGKRFFLRRLGYVRDFIGFKFRKASEARMAFGLGRIKTNG